MKPATPPEANALDRLLPADSNSPEETLDLGRRIGSVLREGDILALSGDLGSGKTVLVKGILDGLGGEPDTVTSPTFTLVHEYPAARCPLYHFDLYRVESVSELFDLGYEDYFFGPGICVIEWAERAAEILPASARRIRIEAGPGDRRSFFTPDQPRARPFPLPS